MSVIRRRLLRTSWRHVKIREAAAQYLAELARRGASAHTLRNYASDLEQFAAYFEPPGERAPPWRT